MGVEKFLDEDGFMEEALEYGQLESRCEMCDHYLGDNACEAYKVIPSKIWNENIYHDSVREDQIGDFIYKKNITSNEWT